MRSRIIFSRLEEAVVLRWLGFLIQCVCVFLLLVSVRDSRPALYTVLAS